MWWAFVPASTRTCSVSFGAVGHGAEELLGQVGVEVADPLGAEVALERGERAAGDVDRARGARLVHRHDGVAVAANARRGRRAPRRAPARARCRCPRPCGAGPVSRSPSTLTSRSSRAVTRHARRAGGRRSRRRSRARPRRRRRAPARAEMSVSPVVRWISAVRLTRGAPWTRRGRGSPRRGRAPRRRARGGPRASPGKDTRAIRRRNVAGERALLEARGAAGGQHVVGAGDVVAEGRGGARPDEHAAGACAPGRRAPRPRRPPARGARARSARPAPERRRGRRSRTSASCASVTLGRSGASRSHGIADRRRARSASGRDHAQRAVRRRARPAPAGRARSARGRRPPPTRSRRARSGRRCRRCRRCRPPGAWPPARTALPGPTITSTAATDSVP